MESVRSLGPCSVQGWDIGDGVLGCWYRDAQCWRVVSSSQAFHPRQEPGWNRMISLERGMKCPFLGQCVPWALWAWVSMWLCGQWWVWSNSLRKHLEDPMGISTERFEGILSAGNTSKMTLSLPLYKLLLIAGCISLEPSQCWEVRWSESFHLTWPTALSWAILQLIPGFWHQLIAGSCSIAQVKAYSEGATCKLKDLVAF